MISSQPYRPRQLQHETIKDRINIVEMEKVDCKKRGSLLLYFSIVAEMKCFNGGDERGQGGISRLA